MSMQQPSSALLLVGLLLAGSAGPGRAEGHHEQEQTATSCSDCPDYSGAFSVSNETGVTIKYQVRWGDHTKWKPIVLETGHVETHRFHLGEDPATKVPTPFVRFDDLADGNRVTFHEYRMHFNAVGYAGYGPKVNTTQAKAYHFAYLADGRHLDLRND